MTSIFTRAFALAAAERAIKTGCQTAAALAVASGTGILDTDWTQIGSVSAMALIVSLLTSVGSDLATDGTGPSLTRAETMPGTVTVTAPPDAETTVETVVPSDD